MASVYNSQLDAFELYHQLVENEENARSSIATSAIVRAIGDGLSGSAGAAISNVVTYPLDLIITRLQIQRQLRKDVSKASDSEYKGLADAAQRIVDKDGWTGLYTGLLSDTGKTIADSFLFFLTYDFLRRRRLREAGGSRKSLPAAEELGVGFIAGSLTKLFTTPIANIVTRKQAAAFTQDEGGKGTLKTQDIIDGIMREKGITGFWSGYSASLILTLNPSLTFFLFETLKRLLLPRSRRDNPPASATFLLAAISKACASSVTYPFSLAKARLQAGGGTQSHQDQDEASTVDSKVSSSHPRTKKAARTTVFSTLLTIADREGLSALYEGVHLEILKAFFSHGTTMLVKQAIQRLLVRSYYVLRLVYSRYLKNSRAAAEARRTQLAAKASKSGYEYYDLAIKRTSKKMDEVKSLADQQIEEAKERAKAVVEFVSEYVPEVGDEENGSVTGGVTGGVAGVGEAVGTSIAKWLDGRRTGEDGSGGGTGTGTGTGNGES